MLCKQYRISEDEQGQQVLSYLVFNEQGGLIQHEDKILDNDNIFDLEAEFDATEVEDEKHFIRKGNERDRTYDEDDTDDDLDDDTSDESKEEDEGSPDDTGEQDADTGEGSSGEEPQGDFGAKEESSAKGKSTVTIKSNAGKGASKKPNKMT